MKASADLVEMLVSQFKLLIQSQKDDLAEEIGALKTRLDHGIGQLRPETQPPTHSRGDARLSGPGSDNRNHKHFNRDANHNRPYRPHAAHSEPEHGRSIHNDHPRGSGLRLQWSPSAGEQRDFQGNYFNRALNYQRGQTGLDISDNSTNPHDDHAGENPEFVSKREGADYVDQIINDPMLHQGKRTREPQS